MPDSAGAAVRLDGLMDQLAAEPGCSAAMYSDGLPAVRHPELVAKLSDDMLRRAHSDLRQAERLARAAAWLSERLGHEPSRAVGFAGAYFLSEAQVSASVGALPGSFGYLPAPEHGA